MVDQQKVYIKLVFRDGQIHPSQDEIIAAFVYELDTQNRIYHNFSHGDVLPNSTFNILQQYLLNKKVFVIDKKRHRYFLSDINLYDVNLFKFLAQSDITEPKITTYSNYLHTIHNRINCVGYIKPYVIHQREFEFEIETIQPYLNENTDSYCYKFFNNVIVDTLFEVEKNGLYVDTQKFKLHFPNTRIIDTVGDSNKGIVYSEYYIYNPTGRPSNKFDGVNYVALNKDDGTRKSFVSRYANGKLIMVDFTGFHPYLVAQLIDYKVPDNETIYEHLAKQYYNIDAIDSDTLSKSKKQTMINLYGQISEKYIKIPYFTKVEQLKNIYWKDFINHGYIKTPIYKRKINKHHIADPNKNKLFAYIIQATETEYGLNSLSNVLKYVSGKPIVPILYIYDGILFDVDSSVKSQEIQDVVAIIRNKRFKVKVYEGNTYDELKLLQI